MNMFKVPRCIALLAVLGVGPAYSAEQPVPRAVLDSRGHVIEVRNLSDGTDCGVESFSGKVIKREYAPDEITMQGIVIEDKLYDRKEITWNFDKRLDRLNMADLRAIGDGLKMFTAIGRFSTGTVFVCGSGGFLYLDSIR